MERGNHHSARLDETMGKETEGMVRAGRDTRAEEWHSAEPSGEDQPDVDRAPDSTLVGGVPDGLTAEEVELRSRLASYLPRSAFPAVREMLIDEAQGRDAPEVIVERVKSLPAGREFANFGEAWAAMGGHHEDHRF